ncbi:MAG TPA: fibronectin type III domain-containing protein, partial [bacterium]|nr:fibronectin type III domain-containing protein [bacterium]
MKTLSGAFIFILALGSAALAAAAEPSPPVTARDAPNDAGESIDISWEPSPLEKDLAFTGYEVLRRAPGDKEFVKTGETAPGETAYQDKDIENGVEYEYRLQALATGREPVVLGTASATASGQWFNTARTNALIGVIFTSFVIIFFIFRA